MDYSLTHNESTLLQAMYTADALYRIISDYDLETNIINAIPYNSTQKHIINQIHLNNPAMLQTILYLLLVIPKELDANNSYLDKNDFNNIANRFAEQGTTSTYNTEMTNNDIDYYRHIRNAIAHSSCEYTPIDEAPNEPYIIFRDKNPRTGESCSIRMKCSNVSFLVNKLLTQIAQYFDNKISGGNNA